MLDKAIDLLGQQRICLTLGDLLHLFSELVNLTIDCLVHLVHLVSDAVKFLVHLFEVMLLSGENFLRLTFC